MTGAPLQTSLGALVRTAIRHFNGKARSAFYLANHEAGTLSHVVGMSDDYARSVGAFTIGEDSLACGLAMHRGEAVITPDVTCDPRWEPWRWLAHAHGFRGCWSFPVRTTDGPVLGTFAVYFAEPRQPAPRDFELAGVITHAATIILSLYQEILDRARAEEALRESESDLRQVADQLEKRVDERTKELIDSQAQLRALAIELNLAEQRERKRLAGELHDYLAQLLVLAKMKLGQGKRLAARMPGCIDFIRESEDAMTEALTYTRTLVADLSPPVLHDFGLPTALGWLGQQMERHQLKVAVRVTPDGGESPFTFDRRLFAKRTERTT